MALVLAVSTVCQAVDAKTLHDQAVENARAGRFDSAIIVLQRLVREQPHRTIYLYDFVAVLSWAERHTEALNASQQLTLDAAMPDYVLAAIGQSALSVGQNARAETAYRLLSQRQPRNADAARGLSTALAAGQQEPALAEARATGTLAVVDSQDAKSTSLAAAQARNAQRIREAAAQLDSDFTLARYRLSDAALTENLQLTAQANSANETDVALRLRRDRVVALRDRGWHQQAMDVFNALDEAEAGAAPAYVVAAAADATLNLRQPERAVVLYKRALQSDPNNTAWLSGAMYAELEAENFPAAERIAGMRLAHENNSVDARRTQALLLRFADRLRDAQMLTQAMLVQSPENVGLWLDQGDLSLRRGLPRAAEARYRAVLAAEPDSIKAHVGLANALWAQGAVVEVSNLVAELKARAPEHPAVQRLLRDWQRNARPAVFSAVTQGFGRGQVQGNDDLVWESGFFSGQSEAGLRGFVNHHLANAQFNGETASHERIIGGLEWTLRDVQVAAEVGRDLRNGQDAVWAAGVAWQVDDKLSMRARYESQTNDFPLKGRTPNAESYLGAPTYLHANKTLVGAAYRWDESRRLAADVASFAFNDGNQRRSLSISWFERLYSAYGRTLDLQAAAYASANTLRDAIYFNPKQDVAWSATLTGDWLTYRRYERSFNQRLALTLGTYKQTSEINQPGGWANRDYGWNIFEELRYEHEWQWGPDFSIRYGIGSRRFPYDGIYETKNFVHAFMNWRLW